MGNQISNELTNADPSAIFTLHPTDHYVWLAAMRARGPIVSIPTPSGLGKHTLWMVTRMQEAVQVLKDSRFTIDRSAVQPAEQTSGNESMGASGNESMSGGVAIDRMMIDGPDHLRLRNLISKAFTPRYIEGLRPYTQQIADDLLDKVQGQGAMDVVEDFAYPLPIIVIADILGVPPDQRDRMRDWAQSITHRRVHSPRQRIESQRALANYLKELIAEKRLRPGNDLISQLIRMEAEEDYLSEEELLAMVGVLIFAGHETTSNLIGIGTLTLLDHPDQMALLQADPSLMPAAVEELHRFSGPALYSAPRVALEEAEIAGQTIHRGDLVLVSLGSANHDETVYSDPEDLNITRQIKRQMGFGQGPHTCLGASLARLEVSIALTTLLRRMPRMRLNAPREEVEWLCSAISRGLKKLPVTF